MCYPSGMLDMLLYILLGGLSIGMAVLGGHVSSSSPKFRLAFYFMGAVAFVLTVAVGVRSHLAQQQAEREHAAEMSEQEEQVEKLEATLQQVQVRNVADMSFLKAKLQDALNGAAPNSRYTSELAAAIEKASAKLADSEAERLSNKQLSDEALELAKRMRTFEAKFDAREEAIEDRFMQERPSTAAQRGALFQQEVAQEEALRNEYNLEFRNTLLGEAVYVRDQLLSRLPKQAETPSGEMQQLAFRGILAGPSPVAAAADYLEKLARELSPQP